MKFSPFMVYQYSSCLCVRLQSQFRDRLHGDGSSCSAAYQRATDGSKPESDRLSCSCRETEEGQPNI